MSALTPLKALLRPVYQLVIRSRPYALLVHRRSAEDLQGYWRAPDDGDNQPDIYVPLEPNSLFLLSFVEAHATKDAAVLELGCNVGRNLHYLHEAGYRNLAAVEISQAAVDRMGEVYPDTAATAQVTVGALEDELPKLADRAYDLVFVVAVFEHIHPDSADLVFSHAARVAGDRLIVVADEELASWRHYPRRYRPIFERLGWRQIEERSAAEIPTMGPHITGRVFERASP